MIGYESEDIDFELQNQSIVTSWIQETVANENKTLTGVTYIFCSDVYLHKLNVEHLQHDTLTDVITFPYSDVDVEGDIFISIDRIRDNAQKFGVPVLHELHRVMIHGMLHLCGYGDTHPKDKLLMTDKENWYLAKLETISKK